LQPPRSFPTRRSSDLFGLSDTVRSVRGKYEALMGETFSRYRAGEPVLFYGWSPGWVVDTLRPGRDVVWLPTPFEALPPGVTAPKDRKSTRLNSSHRTI